MNKIFKIISLLSIVSVVSYTKASSDYSYDKHSEIIKNTQNIRSAFNELYEYEKNMFKDMKTSETADIAKVKQTQEYKTEIRKLMQSFNNAINYQGNVNYKNEEFYYDISEISSDLSYMVHSTFSCVNRDECEEAIDKLLQKVVKSGNIVVDDCKKTLLHYIWYDNAENLTQQELCRYLSYCLIYSPAIQLKQLPSYRYYLLDKEDLIFVKSIIVNKQNNFLNIILNIIDSGDFVKLDDIVIEGIFTGEGFFYQLADFVTDIQKAFIDDSNLKGKLIKYLSKINESGTIFEDSFESLSSFIKNPNNLTDDFFNTFTGKLLETISNEDMNEKNFNKILSFYRIFDHLSKFDNDKRLFIMSYVEKSIIKKKQSLELEHNAVLNSIWNFKDKNKQNLKIKQFLVKIMHEYNNVRNFIENLNQILLEKAYKFYPLLNLESKINVIRCIFNLSNLNHQNSWDPYYSEYFDNTASKGFFNILSPQEKYILGLGIFKDDSINELLYFFSNNALLLILLREHFLFPHSEEIKLLFPDLENQEYSSPEFKLSILSKKRITNYCLQEPNSLLKSNELLKLLSHYKKSDLTKDQILSLDIAALNFLNFMNPDLYDCMSDYNKIKYLFGKYNACSEKAMGYFLKYLYKYNEFSVNAINAFENDLDKYKCFSETTPGTTINSLKEIYVDVLLKFFKIEIVESLVQKYAMEIINQDDLRKILEAKNVYDIMDNAIISNKINNSIGTLNDSIETLNDSIETLKQYNNDSVKEDLEEAELKKAELKKAELKKAELEKEKLKKVKKLNEAEDNLLAIKQYESLFKEGQDNLGGKLDTIINILRETFNNDTEDTKDKKDIISKYTIFSIRSSSKEEWDIILNADSSLNAPEKYKKSPFNYSPQSAGSPDIIEIMKSIENINKKLFNRDDLLMA